MRRKVRKAFMISLTLLLSACGSQQEESKPDIEQNTSEIAEDKETTEETDPNTKKESAVEQNKVETVTLNDLIEFEDHAEVSITTVEFADTINPSNPDGYFTTFYEEKSEGHTYLHIAGTYKSLETDTIDMTFDEPITLKVKYQDKYNYNGFIAIEEKDGSDFDISGYVDPLSTVNFHYIVSVPSEVESSDGSLDLTIKYENDEYKMNIR